MKIECDHCHRLVDRFQCPHCGHDLTTQLSPEQSALYAMMHRKLAQMRGFTGADAHKWGEGKALGEIDADDFATPQWLFNLLDVEYHFALDAAASRRNAKCKRFITKKEDALKQNWAKLSGGKPVYLNPPFSLLSSFIPYAWQQAQQGITVVCIVPIWQPRPWFGRVVLRHGELRHILHTVTYQGSEGAKLARIETFVVVFRRGQKAFLGEPIRRPT